MLYICARSGFTTLCRILLEKGADINAICKETKSTPLHGAAFYNQKDVVKLLLLNGADFKAEKNNNNKDTPLKDA